MLSRQNIGVPTIVAIAVSFIRNIRLYPCNIVFYSWRDYSFKMSSLRKELIKVQNCSRLKLMTSTFNTWKELTSRVAVLNCLEKQLKSASSHTLLNSAMTRWKELQRRQTNYHDMETRAQEFHQLCHLRKHFRSWRHHCDHVIEIKSAKVNHA